MPSIEFIGVSSDDESGDKFRKQWNKSFKYGTKEQLEQQWKELEADKQEALERIRAKKRKEIK